MAKTPLSYYVVILFVLGTSYLGIMFLSTTTVAWLEDEDGPIETFGALCFLGSSVIYLVLYLTDREGNRFFSLSTHRNVFFLLLAMAFFFAFGEEISWGQRIFGFETPEFVARINRQGEFNIHNISIFHGDDATGQRKSDLALLLNMDRLFSLFWLVYCVVIPLGVYFHRGMAKCLGRLNVPIVPILLGLLFPINYLFSKALESSGSYHSVEIKESLFAFLFMLVAIDFLQRHRKSGRTTGPR